MSPRPVVRLPVTLVLQGVAGAILVWGLLVAWADLGTLVSTHESLLVVLVLSLATGDLVRLRMPSGRTTAPLASAAAYAAVFLGPVEGQPLFDVSAGIVVVVTALGFGLSALTRRARRQGADLALASVRLVGVAVAAVLARSWGGDGLSVWALQTRADVPQWSAVVAMLVVAGLAVLVERLLAAVLVAERHHTPWTRAAREELGEAAPLTIAVVAAGPTAAYLAPSVGLLAVPVALFPLALTYVAVGRYVRNRATNRQTIVTLAHLTERGGYTPTGHAERVAVLAVRMGRVLGQSAGELRDLEYAALLHDLGQISLRDPIPGGATVLAAPIDQREIAAEGARIIRHAEGLDALADQVEGQTMAYRVVLEYGEAVPLGARIIKVANAFEDLTEGGQDPRLVESALERIHLGLGYEYDPDVVQALGRVVADAEAGRVGAPVRPSR